MTFNHHEDHFKTFARSLEKAIDRYGDFSEEDLTERQRRQVEGLVELETKFRNELIRSPEGAGVYRDFIRHITAERRNVLDARPFFRERQQTFTEKIAPAIKSGHEKELYPFHFNYRFVQFVRKARAWPRDSEIRTLARQIEKARIELVEMNMPLAISRARIFFSKTQRSHLEYMDLVQIAAEGLIAAVDKFCLPYSPVFRSVAIGRMVGNFIEQYSETLIHFYPKDKRKLYRAHKAASQFKEAPDFESLAAEVNRGADDNWTNPAEIASLLAAASIVSADAPDGRGGGGESPETPSSVYERHEADSEQQPDKVYERQEAYRSMAEAIRSLPLFDQKLLRMFGVEF